LQVDQVRDVLALAGSGGIGNLEGFEPVDATARGEDQQIAVGRGDDEALDEVFGTRAHADTALAAAHLPSVGIDAGALEVAAAGAGDRNVLDSDQILQADLARILDNLGAAVIAVILLNFLELLDDQVAKDLVRAQDFQVLGNAALNFGQLVQDLSLL